MARNYFISIDKNLAVLTLEVSKVRTYGPAEQLPEPTTSPTSATENGAKWRWRRWKLLTGMGKANGEEFTSFCATWIELWDCSVFQVGLQSFRIALALNCYLERVILMLWLRHGRGLLVLGKSYSKYRTWQIACLRNKASQFTLYRCARLLNVRLILFSGSRFRQTLRAKVC